VKDVRVLLWRVVRMSRVIAARENMSEGKWVLFGFGFGFGSVGGWRRECVDFEGKGVGESDLDWGACAGKREVEGEEEVFEEDVEDDTIDGVGMALFVLRAQSVERRCCFCVGVFVGCW
jgi:hypothetical protein